MKNAFLPSKALKIFFVCFFLSNFSAFAQKTTVWFVRHAEKDASASADVSDPGLSADGQKRAQALAKYMKRVNLKAIYVTEYKRTAQTARPLADYDKILPRVYGDSLKTFASTILKNFHGNNVLIVGHSNTLMPLLAAFDSETPFDELDDNDFDMIFKLIVKDNGDRELEVSYYGTLHHSSDLPQKYKEDNRPAQPFSRPITNY